MDSTCGGREEADGVTVVHGGVIADCFAIQGGGVYGSIFDLEKRDEVVYGAVFGKGDGEGVMGGAFGRFWTMAAERSVEFDRKVHFLKSLTLCWFQR